MIEQSLSNTNETYYSIQIVKIYNLNKAIDRSQPIASGSAEVEATSHSGRLRARIFLFFSLF